MFTDLRINIKGANEVRKSAGVRADLERRGEAIRDAAGSEDHEVQSSLGKTRARVTVRTSTWQGRYKEATERTLSSALDAGRD